jgi:hypothetical protein
MREVGHLIGRHDAIDYRGTVNRQGFGDLGVQLAGVLRTESVTHKREERCGLVWLLRSFWDWRSRCRRKCRKEH